MKKEENEDLGQVFASLEAMNPQDRMLAQAEGHGLGPAASPAYAEVQEDLLRVAKDLLPMTQDGRVPGETRAVLAKGLLILMGARAKMVLLIEAIAGEEKPAAKKPGSSA